jgi:serine/threonine protein kinase
MVFEGLPDDSLILCLRGSPAEASSPSTATRTDEPAAATPSGEVPLTLRDHPRYRVEGLLGVSGMGAVFKAEHLLMKRPVALKVISGHFLSHPAAVERFRREVQAAGQLTHPNIMHAYDAEQAGDTHFLVMEYVEGISLARLVAERGPLPVAEGCDYVRQAALGLQHAHERGMVHRDIKPQNLMVARGWSKSSPSAPMAAP